MVSAQYAVQLAVDCALHTDSVHCTLNCDLDTMTQIQNPNDASLALVLFTLVVSPVYIKVYQKLITNALPINCFKMNPHRNK